MITIVSGLPRSGTSLMMQILASSGYDILTDGIRTPDENNPNGYYEYEKVKSLKTDNSWMAEADGKVVKIIAQLLPFIPVQFQYEIYFMERNLDEIISSQSKMLQRLNKNHIHADNQSLKTVFQKQSDSIKSELAAMENVRTIMVSFNNLVNCVDSELESLIQFSENRLEKERILKIIMPELYRERIQN